MIIEDELIIYTAGSCKENPRRGGIGIRYIFPDYTKGIETYQDYSIGSYVGATNQQMELIACIVALEKCLEFEDISKLKTITICVDSNYVKTNINNAKFIWANSNGTAIDGVTPIENIEHWQKLLKIIKKIKATIHFENVKANKEGKLKDIHNEVVDELAKQGADCPIEISFNIINARKKYSEHKAKKGCVRITNNRINIRIIDCTPYKMHKDLFKYQYIVTSEDNPDYQLLDWIYYNSQLFVGHTYNVKMQIKDKLPFIREILEDITKNTRLRLIK